MRVWDLATGTPVGEPFTGHTVHGERGGGRRSWTGAPWWSPAASDGTVRVWDLATGTPVGEPFTGHDRRGERGGGRASWTGAPWWSPAAATGRCGCGTWPPAPRSATRSPATTARVNAVAVGGAGRARRGGLRRQRPDGAGVGPGHRHPGRRPVHRPYRRGERGGGRGSWTGAPWWSPAAATGRCGCGTWPPAPPSASRFTGHTGTVNAVAAGELDGRTVVVSGSGDRTVRVWDLATGTPVGEPLTGHEGGVRSVALARGRTGGCC